MPQTLDPTSLQSLRALKSISNVGGLNRRGLDMASGIDDLGPTDAEVQDEQMKAGDEMLDRTNGRFGYTPSAESTREEGMQALRKALKLESIKHQQELEQAILPKQVEGEYGIKQAEAGAKAGMDRLIASSGFIGQRQSQLQDRVDARADNTQENLNSRQDQRLDAQAARGRRIPSNVLNTIATLRGKAEAGEPNAIMKFFGSKNTNRAALDQALSGAVAASGASADEQNVAKQIAAMSGDVPFDQALAGVIDPSKLTQDEYQMIADLVLLLRGK